MLSNQQFESKHYIQMLSNTVCTPFLEIKKGSGIHFLPQPYTRTYQNKVVVGDGDDRREGGAKRGGGEDEGDREFTYTTCN